jgi:hypothetical protein
MTKEGLRSVRGKRWNYGAPWTQRHQRRSREGPGVLQRLHFAPELLERLNCYHLDHEKHHHVKREVMLIWIAEEFKENVNHDSAETNQ